MGSQLGTCQSGTPAGPIASLPSNGWKPSSSPAPGRRRHRIGVCSSLTAIGHTQVRRFCDVVVPYYSIRAATTATHVMQALDVSIFVALIWAYRHLVSCAAESVGTVVVKAQLGALYAEVRAYLLTQSAARKAFSGSGITLDPVQRSFYAVWPAVARRQWKYPECLARSASACIGV